MKDRELSFQQTFGITQNEMSLLATYNSEKARGIMHTEEWKAKMFILQDLYDTSIKRMSDYVQVIFDEPFNTRLTKPTGDDGPNA